MRALTALAPSTSSLSTEPAALDGARDWFSELTLNRPTVSAPSGRRGPAPPSVGPFGLVSTLDGMVSGVLTAETVVELTADVGPDPIVTFAVAADGFVVTTVVALDGTDDFCPPAPPPTPGTPATVCGCCFFVSPPAAPLPPPPPPPPVVVVTTFFYSLSTG